MTIHEQQNPLDAPADKVWGVLADFGNFLPWATGGNGSIELEGEGVGMIRHMDLPGLGKLSERLDKLDPAQRVLGYSLLGEAAGMAEYRCEVTVADSESGCVLHWRAEFTPAAGLDAADMVASLGGSYDGMSAALAQFVAASS